MHADPIDSAAIRDFFAARGGTDEAYLGHHLPRFVDTFLRVRAGQGPMRGRRVLDVGAHWLHQALIYARAGCQVVAVDLPTTLELDAVRKQANDAGIRLLVEPDLAHARALDALADDSVDLVLFTEIIEHITFNPVAMWTALYRVLRVGGRIVVTTPNYYSAFGRAWQLRRFLLGAGGGLDVHSILHTPTHGPHWKEFSLRELRNYFHLLSPDFRVVRAEHVPTFGPRARGVRGWCRAYLGPLRENLHLEVELTRKASGITVQPAW